VLQLPTPVKEWKILESIARCAKEYTYVTFPPLRFSTSGGTSSNAAGSAAQFGEPPRNTLIHSIVGEVAAPARSWNAKLCQVIRDMECLGFGEENFDGGMLPVLILNGTKDDWRQAQAAMTKFFNDADAKRFKYLGFLKKHLIVLHDEAASHPMNVLAALNPKIKELKTQFAVLKKAYSEKSAKACRTEEAEARAEKAEARAEKAEARIAEIEAERAAEKAKAEAAKAEAEAKRRKKNP
jgi:hypothetical protein